VIDFALPIHGNNVFRSARSTTFSSGVSMSSVQYVHVPVNDLTKSLVICSSDKNDLPSKLHWGGSWSP
jgi:hypothetical protein